MGASILAISAGAVLGALGRWTLEMLLNSTSTSIFIGTLTANLLGGYCIGLAFGVFALNPNISIEWRLFIITGFLGALTTFSSFSAEVVLHLQQQRIFLAMSTILLHVCGSLLMTFLGLYTMQIFNMLKK